MKRLKCAPEGAGRYDRLHGDEDEIAASRRKRDAGDEADEAYERWRQQQIDDAIDAVAENIASEQNQRTRRALKELSRASVEAGLYDMPASIDDAIDAAGEPRP